MINRRKLLLVNKMSPGDILMLTASVRDLSLLYPGKYIISVETTASQIWENNPYIVKFDKDEKDVEQIVCEYPLIHNSNNSGLHFINGFAQFLEDKLEERIRLTKYHGDLHLSKDETRWMSQIEELGIKQNFWLIVNSGKSDFSAKWPNPFYLQEVVDYFKGKILFVQIGAKEHYHTPMKNVINLLGKTDIRQLIRLMYHSIGVITPVSFPMHLAAAIPPKNSNIPNKACVVISGAREEENWERYPTHRYLSRNGQLECSRSSAGCWRSRCQLFPDNNPKNKENVCLNPVQITPELRIPLCINDIKPPEIISAVESYYNHGILKYNND